MAYADTCVVVSLFTFDAWSELASSWAEQSSQKIAFSSWGRCEFTDVVMRRYRSHRIELNEAQELLRRLDRWIAMEVDMIEVRSEDFELSARYLADPAMGIKSKDALHLAIARRIGRALVTSDTALAKASGIAGIPSLLLQAVH